MELQYAGIILFSTLVVVTWAHGLCENSSRFVHFSAYKCTSEKNWKAKQANTFLIKEEKKEEGKGGREGEKNKKNAMKGKKDNNIYSLLLFLTKMLELTPPHWKPDHQLRPVLHLILTYSFWKSE